MSSPLVSTHPQPAGYWPLVRDNTNFRLVWLGSIVSLCGDWFNTIALYTVVERLTSSPLAMGMVFLVKTLSYALASPIAGVIADRYNRRRLMIGTDLVRAVLVLGFLWIGEAEELWLLYVLAALQMMLGAVFIPCKKASVPNIVSARELVTANALMAATWSTLLALGAAAGGLATAWLGTKMVFCIDSATYILSAILLSRARIPQNTRSAEGPLWRQAFRDVIDGWSYLWRHPAVLRISLAKPAWAIGGGALVYMLTLLGDTVAASFALGVGILFSARGLGTGIGPIVARAVFRAEERWPAVMGGCVILSGLGYLVVGYIPWSLWILIPIVISHAASAANWVLSTVILQQRTEDAYRGRVFATEWLTLTLIDAVAIACSSTLLEAGHLSLRTGIRWAAVVQIVTGVLWWLLVIPRERRDPSVDAS